MLWAWILVGSAAGLFQFVSYVHAPHPHPPHHPHPDHECSITDCTIAPKENVCGTDAKVYPTRCHFNEARCTDHSLLETICKGIITTVTTATPVTSTTTTTPLPATSPTTQGTTTSQVGDQFCLSLAHKDCSADYDLLCGSDGVMYRNLCEFQKARCMHKHLTIADKDQCVL